MHLRDERRQVGEVQFVAQLARRIRPRCAARTGRRRSRTGALRARARRRRPSGACRSSTPTRIGASPTPCTRVAKMPCSGGRLAAVTQVRGRDSRACGRVACRARRGRRSRSGRPSRRAAVSKSPAASAARMRVLDTRSPSTSTGSIACAMKPSSSPSSRSSFRSPARPLPKRNSGPTQTSRARRRSHQHVAHEALGGHRGELRVETQQADDVGAEIAQAFELRAGAA